MRQCDKYEGFSEDMMGMADAASRHESSNNAAYYIASGLFAVAAALAAIADSHEELNLTVREK